MVVLGKNLNQPSAGVILTVYMDRSYYTSQRINVTNPVIHTIFKQLQTVIIPFLAPLAAHYWSTYCQRCSQLYSLFVQQILNAWPLV